MKTPDPNARAPRPSHGSGSDKHTPTMDAPLPTQGADRSSFDRGIAAAAADAASGQRPGNEDLAAIQVEGTADTPETERAKHKDPADPESPNDETRGGAASSKRRG